MILLIKQSQYRGNNYENPVSWHWRRRLETVRQKCHIYRYFTSALVDGVLLIDPGPEVFDAAEKFAVDLSGVRYIINTHSHADHFLEKTVERLCADGAQFIKLSPKQTEKLGKYTLTAAPANHPTAENPVHFLIDDGEKKLYYALDSSWLLYEEYLLLRDKGADLMVMDATIGNSKGDYRIFEHCNLQMVSEMKYTLQKYVKQFVISHMAYTLHDDHETLTQQMKAIGIEVAFDGLIIMI